MDADAKGLKDVYESLCGGVEVLYKVVEFLFSGYWWGVGCCLCGLYCGDLCGCEENSDC